MHLSTVTTWNQCILCYFVCYLVLYVSTLTTCFIFSVLPRSLGIQTVPLIYRLKMHLSTVTTWNQCILCYFVCYLVLYVSTLTTCFIFSVLPRSLGIQTVPLIYRLKMHLSTVTTWNQYILCYFVYTCYLVLYVSTLTTCFIFSVLPRSLGIQTVLLIYRLKMHLSTVTTWNQYILCYFVRSCTFRHSRHVNKTIKLQQFCVCYILKKWSHVSVLSCIMVVFLHVSTLTTLNQYILCINYCIMSLIFRHSQHSFACNFLNNGPIFNPIKPYELSQSPLSFCGYLYGYYARFDSHNLFSIDTSVFCIIYFNSHDMYV